MECVYSILLVISFLCGAIVYDHSHEDYKKSSKTMKVALVVLYIVGIVGIIVCYVFEVILCCARGIFNK